MAMNKTMLWNIIIDSSATGNNMNVASINGIMKATNSHGQMAFRSQTLAFNSSLSHTMNRLFIRMINATLHGPTALISQRQSPKAMGNP